MSSTAGLTASARDAGPPVHAAGELLGIGVREFGQVDALERVQNALAAHGFGDRMVLQRHTDIGGDRSPWHP